MEKTEANILVIDDDYDVLKSAHQLLKRFFTKVDIDQIPENIESKLRKEKFHVVLLDMNFKKGKRDGKEGFDWLQRIKSNNPDIVVILMTAYGDVDLAVEAIKRGASDFILKPWQNQKLLATVKSAVELSNSKLQISNLKETRNKIIDDYNQNLGKIIGESKAIRDLNAIIEKVAKTDANVLILGENGTGKELVARTIHQLSDKKEESFIHVDLGAISETLFESELFGHVKGAFTDAQSDKPGRFELASNGTIFLDEIGNLSLPLQAKLLTVLQTKKVMRVGSIEEIPVDFRLLAATNKSLKLMVKDGTFREDLLYRLNTIEVIVPELRNRLKDIPLLFETFFSMFKKKYNRSSLTYNSSLFNTLLNNDWPGNVREFKHAIERAIILNDTDILSGNDFNVVQSPMGKEENLKLLDDVEKQHIIKIIQLNNGNITQAAMDLGISRTALHRRIRKYGL